MSIVLGANNYGKSEVRLVKVSRAPGRHELRDLTVDVALEGDFAAAHVSGDNTGLLATDTMRNTVYALAKQHPVDPIESFGRVLVERCLAAGPSVTRARVRIAQHPWERLVIGGRPHEHAFQRGAGGTRVATVAGGDGELHIEAGIEDLLVLKTTGSGWEGYLRDEYTSLAETDDRIMATEITARWTYGSTDLDFTASWHAVREVVLEARPEIERIRFSLPNRHHLLFDLSRFGLENDHEIFHATTEPYGLIEGTVERSGVPAGADAAGARHARA